MEAIKSRPWRQRLLDIWSPWIWLVYLPIYGINWLDHLPPAHDLIGSAIGIAIFLFCYFYAERLTGRSLIVPAVVTMLTSFALIPFGGNWTVISVYACAIAADLRPARDGAWLVGVLIAASVIVAAWVGVPWYFLVMVGVFEFMVAFGKMSGMALAEKNRALLRAQEEVRLLAQTAERERIARDLHDLLGRTLTLIALKSDLAVKLGEKDSAAAQREMREVGEAAREGLAQVRSAIAGMTDAGLAHEIEASREALAAAGIACDVEGESLAVPTAAGAVLAMALREGVTNVIRHAGATRCRIDLAEAEGEVRLAVIDDGHGSRFREGAGLKGMRARLAAAGGELRIDAGQSGTRIAASVPAAAP
jgi:two-component system sensor histidine kinase DesK